MALSLLEQRQILYFGFPCADTCKQHIRRFLIRVLGHQLPLKRLLEDGLAQAGDALQVGFHGLLRLLRHGESSLHFGDDAALSGKKGGRGIGIGIFASLVPFTFACPTCWETTEAI